MRNIKKYNKFLESKQNDILTIFKYLDLKKDISKELLLKNIDSFNITVNDYILLEKMIIKGFDWNHRHNFERMKIVVNNSNVNHKISGAKKSNFMFGNGEIYQINGLTPLHINAIMSRTKSFEKEMLKLLTNAGANWIVLDENGKSIFDYTKNIKLYQEYEEYEIAMKGLKKLKTASKFNL